MISTADIEFLNADRKYFLNYIESEVMQRYKTQTSDKYFGKARD